MGVTVHLVDNQISKRLTVTPLSLSPLSALSQ